MATSEADVYQGDQEKINRRSVQSAADLISTVKRTLFVVGTAAVVFAALRNSLTFHLQQFWGASGNFWQHQWDKALYIFGNDPYYLIVYGTNLISYIVFWSVGLLYTFMDVINKPACLRRYKVQPGTNEPVDKWKLLQAILWIHVNQLFGLMITWVAFKMFRMRGFDDSPLLPTFHWVLFELVVCILIEEVGFYYTHRLVHHRFLYKPIHKWHHEWQSPIAITAIYAHPLEHLLSNMFPVFLGPFILGSHIATIWLWSCLALLSTLNAHSGYHLPFFPSPEAHDYHHLKFNQCYGVLGIMDFLHGTDEKFRTSKCFSRHILMLSFQPPHEVFPDCDEEKKPKDQ